MPLFRNKVAPAPPTGDGYFSQEQFPTGDDASTVIQDKTKWTTPMLKIERAAAEKRGSLLTTLGAAAEQADKDYADKSKKIIELINTELKRRGVTGGRRRKTRRRRTRRRRTMRY